MSDDFFEFVGCMAIAWLVGCAIILLIGCGLVYLVFMLAGTAGA